MYPQRFPNRRVPYALPGFVANCLPGAEPVAGRYKGNRDETSNLWTAEDLPSASGVDGLAGSRVGRDTPPGGRVERSCARAVGGAAARCSQRRRQHRAVRSAGGRPLGPRAGPSAEPSRPGSSSRSGSSCCSSRSPAGRPPRPTCSSTPSEPPRVGSRQRPHDRGPGSRPCDAKASSGRRARRLRRGCPPAARAPSSAPRRRGSPTRSSSARASGSRPRRASRTSSSSCRRTSRTA